MLPISVQYASDPTDINNVFQFWIIPVKSVTEVANPVHYSLLSLSAVSLPPCSNQRRRVSDQPTLLTFARADIAQTEQPAFRVAAAKLAELQNDSCP